MSNKIKNLIFFLIFCLIANCSFDNKTGIWGDKEKEKKQISELEKKQKEILGVQKVYSSENTFNEKANQWEDYLNKPFNRRRAFIQKALFKVCYY